MKRSVLFLLALALSACATPTPTQLPPELWVDLPAWAQVPENPTVLRVEECNNPLATVNRENLLPVEDCSFTDLIDPNTAGILAGEGQAMRELVTDQIKALFDEAQTAGYPLKISSGWRNCEYQENVFDNWIERGNGDENFANTYTYHCGASSHHLGTVMDLLFGEVGFEDGFGLEMADTQTYQWLFENAAKYGCVLEYPPGKAELTGLNTEPWHWRCGIPEEGATQIMNGELTLAEWLEK